MLVNLNIYEPWGNSHGCHMTIDLEQVCRDAGRREKDGIDIKTHRQIYYTVYPMNKAKKLLKLIKRYADNVEEIEAFLKGYPKVFNIWAGIK